MLLSILWFQQLVNKVCDILLHFYFSLMFYFINYFSFSFIISIVNIVILILFYLFCVKCVINCFFLFYKKLIYANLISLVRELYLNYICTNNKKMYLGCGLKKEIKNFRKFPTKKNEYYLIMLKNTVNNFLCWNIKLSFQFL